MSEAPTGLFDRALSRITAAWRDMASSVGSDEDQSLEAQMRACLAARGGEVSARNRAAKLAQAYLGLDEADRLEFLRTLAGFDADPDKVASAYAGVRGAADAMARASATAELRRALEPPRVKLLTQFTSIPDGRKFLVDLRGFLMTARGTDTLLAALESDLRGLLAAWFDIGFLELHRIDWHSSAFLMEKLMDYEAVHAIQSWRDLKNRLDSDRRCYAFFHPRMPGEPLIFVEVALVRGLSDSVQRLLDEDAPVQDPRDADTAIFYSISNCQPGLAGISFGNFLIKRVVEELSGEFRNLKTFATYRRFPGSGAGWTRLWRPARTTCSARRRVRAWGRRSPRFPGRRRWPGSWPGRAGGRSRGCARRPNPCWCGFARGICCWKARRSGRATRWRIFICPMARGWSGSIWPRIRRIRGLRRAPR